MESKALRNNLVRLLRPRHVAFVGGRVAAGALQRCAQFGFDGPLWHVNPNAAAEAAQVFASVEELPEPPDAAYVALSTEKTIAAVDSLARLGVGGCVCYAAGFAEKGVEGEALQAELVEAAKDMALLGPNCFGLLDYRSGLHLWSGDVHPRFAGPGIGVVSQSGALAEFMTMEQRSMPFVSVVSVGNQAVLSLEQIVDAMLDDPGINAIGVYVEGIRDIPYFSQVAARALDKKVPLVAIKVGRSQTGSDLAKGHTSSIVGTAELYDALFERLGIVQCRSLSEFMETLKLLSVVGPLPGNRIGAITCSGGQAAMLADRAAELGLRLPPLSEGQVAALRAGLPDYVNPMNPLDMTVSPMGDRQQLRLIFDVLAAGDVDVVTAAMDAYPDPEAPFSPEVKVMLEEMAAALRRHHRVGIANGCLHETLPAYIRDQALGSRIAPIQGSDEMLIAIDAAAVYGATIRGLRGKDPLRLAISPARAPAGEVGVLDEAAAKRRLRSAGVGIPRGKTGAADEVAALAVDIGYPLVLKAVSEELLHKSEFGAVAVGLRNEQELLTALATMKTTLSVANPMFLVEEMVRGAVAEVMLGVKYDPEFGYALVISAGGVLVEALADSVTLLMPVERAEVDAAIRNLAIHRLLSGYRGRPAADLPALLETIERIMHYVEAQDGRLIELEINPVMVLSAGRGVIAADALIREVV